MNTAAWILALAVVALAAATIVLGVRWRAERTRLREVADCLGTDAAHAAAAARRVEQQLARAGIQRTQLATALDSADIGIMAVGTDARVLFVNRAAARYLGARHGEAVAELRIRQLLEEAVVGGSEISRTLELYTPVRRVLGLRAIPAPTEGVAALVYIEDLTEQHRVDAIRRDFVANVGHELKTPLGAISILSETLIDTDDPSTRRKLAVRLGQESRRMAKLIDDLLELAHVESYSADHVPVRIEHVIEGATAQIRLAAEELGIDLSIGAVPEEAVVMGDQRQLVSAVANLLDNAVKYTAIEGPGIGKVELRTTADGRWITIEVEDAGIGIPERHLDRIFERFYRVDRARSRETGGTGLGLSIVRHVALNHNGRISARSEEGRGSTFTLALPRWEG